MSAAAADPFAAQRERHRREQEAKRRYREERLQRQREAPCRVACLLCDWSIESSAAEGVVAGRAHRRDHHAGDLPERSRNPRQRRKPTAAAASIPAREQNREAVLRAVKEMGSVVATTVAVAEAAELTPHEAGRLLSDAGFRRVSRRGGESKWWLGTGDPPRPEPNHRICALAECSTGFETLANNRKFCSASCREKSYRRMR